jgi:hypothetical protein
MNSFARIILKLESYFFIYFYIKYYLSNILILLHFDFPIKYHYLIFFYNILKCDMIIYILCFVWELSKIIWRIFSCKIILIIV